MFSYHCGDDNNLEKMAEKMMVPTIQQLVVELMIHQVVIMVKVVVLVASLPSTPLRSKERE